VSNKDGAPAPSHNAAEEQADRQTPGSVRGMMDNKAAEEVSKPGVRHTVCGPTVHGMYMMWSQRLVGFSLVGVSRSQETTADVLSARLCHPSLWHLTPFQCFFHPTNVLSN